MIYGKVFCNFSVKIICGLGLSLGALQPLHAQVSPSTTDTAVSVSRYIRSFGQKFSVVTRAPEQQAKVYVYRVPAVSQPEPVNIYLNGRYHASLMGGGYSEFCAIPAQVLVRAVANDAAQMHTGKQAAGQSLSFQADQTIYLKVLENPATDTSDGLVQVSLAQAQRELDGTALQIHTLSRSPLALSCQEGTEVPTAVVTSPAVVQPVIIPASLVSEPRKLKRSVEPSRYAFSADDFFEFGQATLKNQGEKSLNALVEKLKKDFRQIEQVMIAGYTDAIGPDSVNQKLSQARAETVAQALRERGVEAVGGFKAEGLGARNLVKTLCGDKPTPKNKVCHAPNRRVEMNIIGVRR